MEIPDKALDWLISTLDEKWKNAKCNGCGAEQKWIVHNQIYDLREFKPTGFQTHKVLPVVIAECAVCGYLRSGNAISLGVIDETGALRNV